MALIGEADYRGGARDRLEEAYLFLREGRFGGCVYLAGRAVEGMLRAVIWKSDTEYAVGKKTLNTGHDLREILNLIRKMGILRNHEIHDSIAVEVQKVARLWSNNMRFLPTIKIEAIWYNLGEIDKSRRTMKRACQEFWDACSVVVRRCEAIWQQPR